MTGRLRLAAVLIVVGLIVELATLSWTHPTAFLAFAGLGAGLVAVGILLYFWTILRAPVADVGTAADDRAA